MIFKDSRLSMLLDMQKSNNLVLKTTYSVCIITFQGFMILA